MGSCRKTSNCQPLTKNLALCLALLVCHRAGGLAGGLAGALALAAAALFGGSLEISLVNCYYVTQKTHLVSVFSIILPYDYTTYRTIFQVGISVFLKIFIFWGNLFLMRFYAIFNILNRRFL